MLLVSSDVIRKIDEYAKEKMHISTDVLMGRSADAVVCVVREIVPHESKIVILVGCGNNGGDGYAAGTLLSDDYSVVVYSVLGKSPKSEAAIAWRNEYLKKGGKVFDRVPELSEIEDTTCVIDAVFGVGFSGSVSGLTLLCDLIAKINKMDDITRIAVDIPFGVNSDTGAVCETVFCADITVSLSFPKVAHFSYPAKSFVGRVVNYNLGLPFDEIKDCFSQNDFLIDRRRASSLLPKREDNTSKGSFGKTTLVVGSDKYVGAAYLATEAALRGGVGYVRFAGTDALCERILQRFPECLCKRFNYSDAYERDAFTCDLKGRNSLLIGSGSGVSENLYELVKAVLLSEGCDVILDADALNSISIYASADIFLNAKRKIIITPHPLEFARLIGRDVEFVQNNRYEAAKSFAKKYGCTVVLKGAATIVTDGEITYVNGTGSSALAKAGSGDVLSGLIAAFLATCNDALVAAALAVYVHASAGDALSSEYSNYGVTPSDLPKMAAKILAELEMESKSGI